MKGTKRVNVKRDELSFDISSLVTNQRSCDVNWAPQVLSKCQFGAVQQKGMSQIMFLT